MATQCIRCRKEIEITYRACPHCGEVITDFARRYTDEPVDGKYRIVERLGAGGMGEVFKVTHTFLGTTRVIKVIRPHISDSKEAHDRFLREARAATKVTHPNVAAMHDFAELPDGSHYMVWEYIDGENLAQRLRARGPLPLRAALRIIVQALHGLEAIHRAGIIHRDISPENLMITHDGDIVKIIDLGVAKVDDTTTAMATQTGMFVGKLRYASPEHLGFLPDGEKIDGRADLYSMAMVLYETVTGRPPFEATSPHQYFILHSQEKKLPSIDYTNVPLPLRDALHRGLEHNREKRFGSAREFAAALEEIERAIPDANDMKTVAETPLPDMDATFKQVDTLHRETLRTAAPSAPAVPTTPAVPIAAAIPIAPPIPIKSDEPARPAAVQTVIDPKAAPRSDDRWRLVAVIAAVFLILGGAGAWFFWPRDKAEPAPVVVAKVTPSVNLPATPTTAAPAPQPSATAIDVIDTTTTQAWTLTAPPPRPTPTAVPIAQQPIANPEPVQPRPQPQLQPQQPQRDPDAEPAPEREPQRATLDGAPLYVDGGDDDLNDQAMDALRTQLGGSRRVAVHAASDMRQDVIESIREAGIDVVDAADVVVQFNGTLESLGRGRKLRAANAMVKKNGRVIFRYKLPQEVYRVGATPAEAFARVLSDAF